MITPEYLNKIYKATERQAAELNNYLTGRITKRLVDAFFIDGNPRLIPASVHDLHKMMALGKTQQDVRDEMIKRWPAMQKDIEAAFLNSAAEISRGNLDVARVITDILGISAQVPELEKIGLQKSAAGLKLTPAEIRLMDAAYRRTNGEIKNLTGTVAYKAEDTFVTACDTAFWKVKHGVSLNTAVIEAIKEVSSKGITVRSGNTGREESIETAIARAVRTGVNQANADICLTRSAEMGVNYVLVSQHYGARVTNTQDYKDHSWWQGQVYKINWSTNVMNPFAAAANENMDGFEFLAQIRAALAEDAGYNFPDFEDTCGYGDILGICGINCRHTFAPFYPGVQDIPPIYVDPEESEQRFKNEKQARSMERDLRQRKRRIENLKNSGLDSDELKKALHDERAAYRAKDAAYRKFLADNNMGGANYRKAIGIDRSQAAHENSVGNPVYFNPQKSYEIKVETLTDTINAALSKAAKEVAEKGSATRHEYGMFVDLDTGEISKMFTDDLPKNVSLRFDWILDNPQHKNIAFIHNHNTDTTLSLPDVAIMANETEIQIVAAVRNDGVISLVESNGNKTKKYIYLYYEDLTKQLREESIKKHGVIAHVEVELKLVEQTIKDFAKGDMKIYGL